MNTMGIFWLGVMILAAVVEAAVPSLVSVWFVPGGLAALIVSLLGGQLWLQVAVFLAVSAVALALTRPLSKRLLNRRRERTNADRVVGAAGLVTQDIDNVGHGPRLCDGEQLVRPFRAARGENPRRHPGTDPRHRGGQAAGHAGGRPRPRGEGEVKHV